MHGEILLDACRVEPAPYPTYENTDWPALLDAAEYHAVTPLLARRLGANPHEVPPRVLETLRARYDANALRNVVLTRTLAEILQHLGASAVDAMPIKGPALAIAAYGDLALREFGDLDIVVRPEKFDRARELLHELGYRPLTPLTGEGERVLRGTDHHMPLVHEESRVMVELHWSLDNGRPGRYLDADWVWSNARTVSLLGRELPALSWSALLVYLCVHGAKHGWTSLGWIRDVAGVVATAPDGELAMAAPLAAAADARRRLALGVTLARSLLAAPERGDLAVNAGDAVARLERDVRARLFDSTERTRGEWVAFQCRTFDAARDRVGYLWHIVAAPHVADVQSVALPRWLRWLYFLLRPARLAAERASALLGARSRS
ncbi:MAG TPA: nucleotidyltransferase family protein [Gemmatimonadaceae bacterium]|nr:nucleotidyltransferase family protein [Gemmatimonadaceae bacterium]